MDKNNQGVPCYDQQHLNTSYQTYEMGAQVQNFNFTNPYAPYYFRNDSYSPQPTQSTPLMDYGPNPIVINMDAVTSQNTNFRTTLWTGTHHQLTLMSINASDEIGLEVHPNLDQFIRIEDGQGLVKMGTSPDHLSFQTPVYKDFAFIIPAGTYHNLINTGHKPLKLSSIYAPTQHPFGTIHVTKADAQAAD
ncbi:MAG: cupin domain-containing protein [Turicibacter sp.]